LFFCVTVLTGSRSPKSELRGIFRERELALGQIRQRRLARVVSSNFTEVKARVEFAHRLNRFARAKVLWRAALLSLTSAMVSAATTPKPEPPQRELRVFVIEQFSSTFAASSFAIPSKVQSACKRASEFGLSPASFCRAAHDSRIVSLRQQSLRGVPPPAVRVRSALTNSAR
jgi:hypothetical protein